MGDEVVVDGVMSYRNSKLVVWYLECITHNAFQTRCPSPQIILFYAPSQSILGGFQRTIQITALAEIRGLCGDGGVEVSK